MQWITKNKKCDGIRYFSMNLRKEMYDIQHNIKLYSNYAFPTRTLSDAGFCTILNSKFKVSNPYNWELAFNMKPLQAGGSASGGEIILNKSSSVNYSQTNFSLMEAFVNASPQSPVI